MKKILLVLASLILPCLASAQHSSPNRDFAEIWMEKAQKHLQYKYYFAAASAYDSAAHYANDNTLESALYLSGISWYYAEDDYKAINRWTHLVQAFPASRFFNEIKYHQALIELRDLKLETRAHGIYTLLYQAEFLQDVQLAKDAWNAFRNHLFNEASLNFLAYLLQRSKPRHELMLVEAYCGGLINSGQEAQAKNIYALFRQRRNRNSAFLDQLFGTSKSYVNPEPGIVRLAMLLPLNLNDPYLEFREEIAANQKPWLEFYEGFQIALQNHEESSKNKFFLEVIDTQKDSTTTIEAFKQLDKLHPQMVIGDIFNQTAELIGDWASQKGVPHLVPLSSIYSMEGRTMSLMAHPDFYTRGKRMAEYAWHQLGKQHIMLVSDQKENTHQYISGFAETFQTFGGRIHYFPVDSVFERDPDKETGAKFDISRGMEPRANLEIDGIYAPIRNEEIAGMLLSELARLEWYPQIFANSRWARFESVDKELLIKMNLLYTSTDFINQNDSSYLAFYDQYLEAYEYPPSNFCVMGYDLGTFILPLIDNFQQVNHGNLLDFMQQAKSFQSLHLDYDFAGKRKNQFVNILAYTNEGAVRVNTLELFGDSRHEVADPFDYSEKKP